MIKNIPICLLLLSVSLLAQGTYTYHYLGAPLYIFTDDANVVTVAGIRVDRAFMVQKATVSVNIAFTPVGDLKVYLYSPDGTRTKLADTNCGSQSTLVNISFDDSAQSKYSDFCPAEAGRGPFRPFEPLSHYQGKSSIGTWRLAVENSEGSHTGWLNGWTLTLNGGPVTQPTVSDVVNASSLKTGAVAPNSLIMAYGENLGPSTAAFGPTGQPLPTTLSGVQILLNGTAIPLRGVYANAVQAVVPADVVVGSKPNLQVSVNGATSNITNLTTQASVPGLFSQGRLGDPNVASWAIVKATDTNYKVITPDNPAVQGSVVIVYATGLGATNPALPAGQVPGSSPLYVVTAPTYASVGGVLAQVLFAGLAPGYPGVYQVNIQLPTGLAAGYQPILLWSGGGVSQDNLSIPVK